MSLFDRLIRLSLPLVPRFVVNRVARRYIAGPSLADALRTVRELNAEGALATVDLLGEEARDERQVEEAVEEYARILEGVKQEGLGCNISAKPTLFGLRIDRELCLRSLDRVAAAAAASGSFLRLDMEDHTATDATLELFRTLHERHGSVGVVLQAMLRRTPADIGALAGRKPNIRLWVYVPYGADWYRYSLRRLRENPSIARHLLRALFRRERALIG